MVTFSSYRPSRYLYLGGPVETARFRARRLALMAILIYAACLFGAVMLAHGMLDRTQAGASDAQIPALQQPAPGSSIFHARVHRL